MLADGVSNKYAPGDIYDVMSKIVNSEDNTIPFHIVYSALGREKVEAMTSDGNPKTMAATLKRWMSSCPRAFQHCVR